MNITVGDDTVGGPKSLANEVWRIAASYYR